MARGDQTLRQGGDLVAVDRRALEHAHGDATDREQVSVEAFVWPERQRLVVEALGCLESVQRARPIGRLDESRACVALQVVGLDARLTGVVGRVEPVVGAQLGHVLGTAESLDPERDPPMQLRPLSTRNLAVGHVA